MHILLADNDASRSSSLAHSLRALGHSVLQAGTTPSALEALRTEQVHLVLFSHAMDTAAIASFCRHSKPSAVTAALTEPDGQCAPPPGVELCLTDTEPEAVLTMLSQAQELLDQRQVRRELMNIDELCERFAGDTALLANVLAMYLEDGPDRFNTARACLATGDLAGANRAAHSLKGISGSVGCKALSEAAMRLELACRADGPVEPLKPLLDEVETLLQDSLHHARHVLADISRTS